MTITITDSHGVSFTDQIYLRQLLTAPVNVTVMKYTVFGAATAVALAAPYATCKHEFGKNKSCCMCDLHAGSDTLDVRFDYFIPGVQYNSVYANMSRSTHITLNTPSKLWQVSATIYNGVDDLTTAIPVRAQRVYQNLIVGIAGEHRVLCAVRHQSQLYLSI